MEHDKDNGMITKIWGPHMWVSLHCIAYCYPINPTQEDKNNYLTFFKQVGNMLPCPQCKVSYNELIKCGMTKLDDSVMRNRESITKWLYYIHEAVNNKLGVNYSISYDDVTKRYESYRATCPTKVMNKCDASIDKKKVSYEVDSIKDCPTIPLKMADSFVAYAKTRGLKKDEFFVIDAMKGKTCLDELGDDILKERNKACGEIIKKMNLEGIRSIETSGKWEGMPSVEELKLIMRLSSNISINKLTELITKLPTYDIKYKKVYKLIS